MTLPQDPMLRNIALHDYEQLQRRLNNIVMQLEQIISESFRHDLPDLERRVRKAIESLRSAV